MLLPLLLGAVRAFSADYCADQYVLALAERGQIAALSVDAEKDFSYLREAAEGLPQARADAEQVAAARADIVIRFWGGDARRLTRLGAKVVTLEYAADFAGVRRNILAAAAALGRKDEGEALVRDMELRLDALARRGASGEAALYVTPGGVTAGTGTMVDAIFGAAGVENIAASQGLSYWPPLAAESLIADPPKTIVTGFFASDSERINHWSAARHPALRKTMAATLRIDLPADVLACPGWFALDAAETIRSSIEATGG